MTEGLLWVLTEGMLWVMTGHVHTFLLPFFLFPCAQGEGAGESDVQVEIKSVADSEGENKANSSSYGSSIIDLLRTSSGEASSSLGAQVGGGATGWLIAELLLRLKTLLPFCSDRFLLLPVCLPLQVEAEREHIKDVANNFQVSRAAHFPFLYAGDPDCFWD